MKTKLIALSMVGALLLCAWACWQLDDDNGTTRIWQHETARSQRLAVTATAPPSAAICAGAHRHRGAGDPRRANRRHRPLWPQHLHHRCRRHECDQCGGFCGGQCRAQQPPRDTPAFSTRSEIRIRGNSSRTFEKLPYLLNFLDDQGKNNDIAVMGMDAHHEWVLHGPYLDKSLIRNYLWYNLAGEVMDYAPNVRFCELILNGEYRGLYLMTESVTAGDDCRLPLSASAQDKEISGYLLRLDRFTEAELGDVRDIESYLERSGQQKKNLAHPLSEAAEPDRGNDPVDRERFRRI